MTPQDRLYYAIDVDSVDAAIALIGQVVDHIGGIKLGLEFFVANGPAGVISIRNRYGSVPLFLDLKLHDIPSTVSGSVAAATALMPTFITIHAAGGAAMIAAARAAAEQAVTSTRPKILAVTVLTSLDDADLTTLGIAGGTDVVVACWARQAVAAGADGLVCSAKELAVVRAAVGPRPTLMIPGIRLPTDAMVDQKRVMDPATAVRAGADHLVVGRPITQADDPAAAAARFAQALRDTH
jgi:orotidine-5'-phosphate decarboxylase